MKPVASVSVSVTGLDVTERARQYRATFENAAVGIAHVSSDLRWLRANKALGHILGWPIDELLTKSLRDISHADDLAVDLAHVEQIRAGKIDSYGMDKRYLRKDRTIIWGRLTVGCVRRSDGSIDYFVAVVGDISARKRAEELLKRQADLLDQSHDAILELQTGGRGIVYWNRGAERLYGYTAAEAEGRRTHELLHTRAPIPIKDIDAQIVHGEAGAANSPTPRVTDKISWSKAALSPSPMTARCLRWRRTATLRTASVPKRN